MPFRNFDRMMALIRAKNAAEDRGDLATVQRLGAELRVRHEAAKASLRARGEVPWSERA
jgi:hypothetical protein